MATVSRGICRRAGVTVAAIALASLAVETWLLVGRRAGEPAYDPPAGVRAPSLEAAGPEDLAQSFVPGADGLVAVSFVPLPSAGLRTPVDLQLDVEGEATALARRRIRPE